MFERVRPLPFLNARPYSERFGSFESLRGHVRNFQRNPDMGDHLKGGGGRQPSKPSKHSELSKSIRGASMICRRAGPPYFESFESSESFESFESLRGRFQNFRNFRNYRN